MRNIIILATLAILALIITAQSDTAEHTTPQSECWILKTYKPATYSENVWQLESIETLTTLDSLVSEIPLSTIREYGTDYSYRVQYNTTIKQTLTSCKGD